jgi:nitrous oxidase accessory protein
MSRDTRSLVAVLIALGEPRNRERVFAVSSAVVLVVVLVAAGVATGSTPAERGDDVQVTLPSVDANETGPLSDGVARVHGETYQTVEAALAAASPGDTVHLDGRFDERVVVSTPNVTLAAQGPDSAVIDGGGTGETLTIDADGVTVRGVWIRNSGYEAATNDAAVFVNGSHVTLRESRVTDATFGVWLDGVTDAHIVNNTITGREEVRPLTDRGNGIQIWKTNQSVIANNRITDVRDGIYYSWASDVLARDNVIWNVRYGVHYMYSDDNQLVDNTAADNDVGYALMVSKRLSVRNNTAVNNAGSSGHGILMKSIDETTVRGNDLVGNGNGLFLYNSLDNRIQENLLLENDKGVHLTAGSTREVVSGNSFIRNDRPVWAVVGEEVVWNESRGNYWGSATVADIDGDGLGDGRYKPAGAAERLLAANPSAELFTASPAFDAVRRAERTVPMIETPGVVDYRPVIDPLHPNWREYYERN